MENKELVERFGTLTTAHLADGCIRAGVAVRCAPAPVQAVIPGSTLAGRVSPARHAGSVDVFLEAINAAEPGDVLVVDNGGRMDESCIGDLVALEAKTAGMGGIVIWGLNRDSVDLAAIDLTVFSMGSIPTGPLQAGTRRSNALESATVGDWTVGRDDVVLGDEDGVLFVPANRADEVFGFAETIRDTERAQAERIRSGVSLREQVMFDEYLTKRESNPAITLREHLRDVGGAIEV
jgi:regulator of RNase E activity RraA